jgi:Ca-activated chloride channel family protein
MTEHDLNRLKHLPVPLPRSEAKRAAIEVALTAFDRAAQSGSIVPLRRSSEPATSRKITPTRCRTYVAIAASLAALALAGPPALQVVRTGGEEESSSQLARSMPAPQVQTPASPDTLPAPTAQPGGAQPQSESGREPQQPIQLAARPRPAARAPTSPARVVRPNASSRGAEAFRAAVEARPVRSADPARPQQAEEGRDRFPSVAPNPVKKAASEPVSTFSIDVDTASYAFVRRALNAFRLPPRNAVRVEEMINYFPYAYPAPADRNVPFLPTVTVFPAPWNPANKLVHVAIKGYDVVKAERPRVNLVLLIDTSGSMAPPDRLPLLKNAFRMLVDTLQPDDTVGIVTYAGTTRVALEPTKVVEGHKIVDAIDRLEAAGLTAGGAGIEQAYRMAESAFDRRAVNRVILATDGDFNVGITDVNELKGFVERKRETGIFLSILGVGRGNYNDALMQALAQNGNGVAAHIDTLNEARKVLVEEASSTLFPIAKDVKIQIEFNPARVAEYRLIGYETRLLRREDFNNDKVDAGDIGSGHAVTAIYEITPVGSPRLIDDLRYGQPSAAPAAPADGKSREYGFLRINYKLPKEDTSRRIELAVMEALERPAVGEVSAEARFSTAVAAFGQLLRGEPYLKSFSYVDVIALANGAKGDDPFGYRAEFVNLVRLAKHARP